MINVSIVEDDDKTREAWAILLRGTPGFRCLSTHQTGEDALQTMAVAQTDLAVIDLNLPGLNGIETIHRLRQRRPDLLCCIFTVHEETDKVFESLKAGACGYVLKKTPPARILELFIELCEGGAPMSPGIARKVLQFFHALPQATKDLDELSDRHREILHHLAQGKSNKEIADHLGISVNTVGNHVARIYRTLQVHSRAEATKKYLHGR